MIAAPAHVNPEKVREVDALADLIRAAKVVGVVDIRGIPAQQFQAIRRRLRGKAEIRVAKNSLLRLAFERAASEKKGLDGLAATLEGPSAVVATDLNPFRLFKELEATKTSAPARGGEAAPADIWVRGGETPFKPGPIVGDLQKAGIPAAIEKGKVVVKKDKLLVKGGERIPREVAAVLGRLEIFPLIVGLDLRAAFEDGQLYGREVLAVDDTVVRAQVGDAIRHALGLSIFIEYPTAFTLPFLITKAYREAVGLAMEAGFPTPETAKFLLAKAHAQALALAARVPQGLVEATKKES